MPPKGRDVKSLERCVVLKDVAPIDILIVGVWQGRLNIIDVKNHPIWCRGLEGDWGRNFKN